MFDEETVEEFYSINASAAWNPEEGTTPENPSCYSVFMCDPDIKEYRGCYNLDGTIETYQAAVKNFKKICKQLLVKGYCMADDFENFEWY